MGVSSASCRWTSIAGRSGAANWRANWAWTQQSDPCSCSARAGSTIHSELPKQKISEWITIIVSRLATSRPLPSNPCPLNKPSSDNLSV
jgi:hypothetical protein